MNMNKIKVLCILTVLLLSGCGNSSSSQLESSSTSQVVLSESDQSMSDQSVSNQSVTTDILIISREYRHGWNDNDNGMFYTIYDSAHISQKEELMIIYLANDLDE